MWISLLWFESSMQCRESYGEVQRQAYMSKVCLLAARHCWNGWNMYSQNKFSWWKELSISNSVFSNLGLLCLMFQSGVTSNDGKQTLELVCRSLEAGPLEYHVSMLGSTSNCWFVWVWEVLVPHLLTHAMKLDWTTGVSWIGWTSNVELTPCTWNWSRCPSLFS